MKFVQNSLAIASFLFLSAFSVYGKNDDFIERSMNREIQKIQTMTLRLYLLSSKLEGLDDEIALQDSKVKKAPISDQELVQLLAALRNVSIASGLLFAPNTMAISSALLYQYKLLPAALIERSFTVTEGSMDRLAPLQNAVLELFPIQMSDFFKEMFFMPAIGGLFSSSAVIANEAIKKEESIRETLVSNSKREISFDDQLENVTQLYGLKKIQKSEVRKLILKESLKALQEGKKVDTTALLYEKGFISKREFDAIKDLMSLDVKKSDSKFTTEQRLALSLQVLTAYLGALNQISLYSDQVDDKLLKEVHAQVKRSVGQLESLQTL